MQHLKKTPEELWFKFARTPIVGEKYGIEFEVEATNYLPTQNDLNKEKLPFIRKADNSLRGNAAEFISAYPLSFDEMNTYCERLYTLFATIKTKVNKESPRTSTHVHMNFSDRTIEDIINFICQFYCVENLMLSIAGPKRVHNQFCYSLQDAEDQLSQLDNLLTFARNPNNPQQYKYANLNICNLSATGTLEIRSLEGYPEQKKLKTWLQILHELYLNSQARNFSVVDNIVNKISDLTPYGWLKKASPTLAETLRNIPRTDIEQTIYEDFRLIQPFIFRYAQTLNKLKKEDKEPAKKLEQKENLDEAGLNQIKLNQQRVQEQIAQERRGARPNLTRAQKWVLQRPEEVDRWVLNPGAIFNRMPHAEIRIIPDQEEDNF